MQELARLDSALAAQAGPVVSLEPPVPCAFSTFAVSVLLELRKRLMAQGKTLTVTEDRSGCGLAVGLYGVADLLPA